MHDKKNKTKSKKRKSRSRKPRLVGWKQFLLSIGAKGTTYSFAVLCLLIGGVILLFSLVTFVAFCSGPNHSGSLLPNLISSIEFIGVPAGIGTVLMWYGDRLYRRADKMRPVELITRHNTGRLPEVETLVRASDLPSTIQQAELLRASLQGQETPPEQLLRATQESNPDV